MSLRACEASVAPPTPEPRVRVVIADQDALARSMLRGALDDAEDIATVATTGDGREVLELVGYYCPTMLVLETSLLSERGMDLIQKVRLASAGTRVLTISAADDATALAALRAGSFGHLSKDTDPGELVRLIKRAAAGEAMVPRRLTAGLLELLAELPSAGWRPVHSRLTNREWEIVELLADGASTQDIAERLVLSTTTVYSHVKSLLRKLGVHSRQDAVLAAHRLRHEEVLGQKSPWRSWNRSTSGGETLGNAWIRETPPAGRTMARVHPPEWQGAIRM